jgi:hypothetical protein
VPECGAESEDGRAAVFAQVGGELRPERRAQRLLRPGLQDAQGAGGPGDQGGEQGQRLGDGVQAAAAVAWAPVDPAAAAADCSWIARIWRCADAIASADCWSTLATFARAWASCCCAFCSAWAAWACCCCAFVTSADPATPALFAAAA